MSKAKFLAAASVLALGVAFAAHAQDADKSAGKVKCNGIAKAGQNDCKSATNDCAGQAKQDGGWKYVASEEECAKQGGSVVK